MTETSHSQRRACALVGMDPKTYRYESRRPDDAGIRKRLRELAEQRRRFGYRRLHILLAREGIRLNHKKLYRIYREERLTVRKRGGRKRALGTRAPLLLPWNRNQRWSLDFVADALADGRRFRILAVVDDFSRECLALVVDTSLSGVRVARELDRIVELRGRPRMLVSDNGTELTSNAILRWQQDTRRWLALHRTGQAHPKRLCRELQRPPARRVPQRTSLRRPGRSAADHRGMEVRLQHNTPAHEPGWAHTQRVCSPPQLGP